MVDFNENVLARNGENGRDHIPAVPFWVAIIRAAQFVLALLTMILCAFASSVFGVGFLAGYGMTFFTFAWTIIFLAYIFVTPLWYPEAYLYWVQLGLEIASVVFWLTAFALLAEEASAFDFVDSFGLDAFLPEKYKSAEDATKAAAGLGALVWILFVVTLIVFSVHLHKHRVALGKTGTNRAAAAPVDAEKGNTVVTSQPVELNERVPQQHVYSAPVA